MPTWNTFRGIAGVCGSVALLTVCLSGANRGPIRQLSIDPQAEIVPLFEGTQAGQFEVFMSATNEYHSNVVIANNTAEPLTVALPKAAVGVHVLPQFGNQPGGFFGQGSGQNNFGNSGFGNGAGQNQSAGAQAVGGTFQGMSALGQQPGQNQGQFGQGVGQGFPSLPAEMLDVDVSSYGGLATIPPQKSILVTLKSVCLNYGKPTPMPRMTYQLIPSETYTSDPVLMQLLESYNPRVDREVMQAAAWHVASGLSWDQIHQLTKTTLPGVRARLFSQRQVQLSQQLISAVTEAAKTRPEPAQQTPTRSVANVD